VNGRTTASVTAFAWLTLITLAVIGGATLLGPTWPTWDELALTADVFTADAVTNPFWHLRVPRSVLGALAGAGLAIGGVIFQALFRNPLAEPYTLGVASGAALAAALGFLLGVSGTFLGLPMQILLALVGATAALGAVALMDRLRPGVEMTRLLLAGVCVSYLSAAGILLVTFLADRTVTNEIVIWLMGSLGVYRPRANLEVALVLLLVVGYGLFRHRALDLLAMDERLAATRGIATRGVVWSSLVLVGALTAVIVANCGPIGFVGLMVPHMARALFGVRTLPLLLSAGLIGAGFLTLCDGIGRVALSVAHQQPVGYEFPVGVITNMVGAVFFFYLLATRDATRGAW
jgi:iron complex transport system permease protein